MVKKKIKENKIEKVFQHSTKKTNFKRALSVWKRKNPQRAIFFEDSEAIELFVKKFIPSLETTQEEFNKVFEKF